MARPGVIGYLFTAPFLVLFAVFVLVPAVFGAWMSLHDWTYLGPHRWAGMDNYTALVRPGGTTARFFWESMANTGVFVLLSVPPLVVLPLLVALLMNTKLRGRTFFRALYFAPYVLGVAVVGVLWRFLLDPTNGAINHALGAAVPWTTSLPWVWISLVGVTVWWTLGFNAVIFLAGLQEIPRERYEAARLDGASAWQQLVHITLPALRPVLAFVLTVTVIGSGNMFGQAYLITGGGPAGATRTAVMYIADEGLQRFRLGQAAAMGFVLAALLALAGRVTRWLSEEGA